uniref:Neural cell adhesion molecule L1 n=1 Tax=Scleropages formosus TaxID=113540 RepID=A0A8C9W4F9_SCLFO
PAKNRSQQVKCMYSFIYLLLLLSPSPLLFVRFRWVKDGQQFDPASDPQVLTSEKSGTFSVVSGDGPISKYMGKYRCYASNELGTAISEEAQLITENTPILTKEKRQRKTVEEGDKAILNCNPPSSSTPPNIHWMDKNLQHIHQSDRVTKGLDGRLYFSHVIPSDSRDDYICHAQYVTARTILPKEPIQLIVTPSNSVVWHRKPHLLHPTGSETRVLALRGQSLVLECIPKGLPTPSVTWQRLTNGVLSTSRTSTQNFGRWLRFNSIDESDQGDYECIANNSQGTAKHFFTVTVEAAPYWIKKPASNLYAPGENVRLECHAEGIPTPTITWSLNGNPLSGELLALVDTSSSLLQHDTAVYQCEASNKHGIILVNTYIHVIELPPQILTRDMKVYRVTQGQTWLGPLSLDPEVVGIYICCRYPHLLSDRPDPPFNLTLTNKQSRSLTLSWIPGNDHNSPINEFVVEYEELRSRKGHWQFLLNSSGDIQQVKIPLQPFCNYTFRVTAFNEFGRSEPSNPSETYRTPPAAPDRNPEDVRTISTEPGVLTIAWKEMDKYYFNGPGYQYKVMWRAAGHRSHWNQSAVSSSPFVVREAGTFQPFEIKVKAVNQLGEGPDPILVTGHSGEDRPLMAPQNIAITPVNGSVVQVKWVPVSRDSVQGHLLGYKGGHESDNGDSWVVDVSGSNQVEEVLEGLRPYSKYELKMTAYNSKGEGPFSGPHEFDTPEGVPGAPASLTFDSPSETSLTLHWSPPRDPNGKLIGYLLHYQESNNNGLMKVLRINDPDVYHITLDNLDPKIFYAFYLSASTSTGPGESIVRTAATLLDGGIVSTVTWKLQSSAIKAHHPCGCTTVLSPGPIQIEGGFATQGWFIGLISAIVLLLLVLLILCFIKRSKGGKYSVKDKEEGQVDSEARPMKDDAFGEYSDNEEKRSVSQPSLGVESKLGSDDSLAGYGDSVDIQFNEDGSFIGQYSGHRDVPGAVGHDSSGATSPVNPMIMPPSYPGVPNSVTGILNRGN